MGTIYGYSQYMKRQLPKQVEIEASKPQIIVEGLPAEILSAFKLEPTTASGNKGGAWNLTTMAGDIMLKEEHGNLAELQERLSWQQYLRDNGIKSVPELLMNTQGELISKAGESYYYGWVCPQGEPFFGKEKEHLYSAITTLAKVHAISGSYEQERNLPQKCDWPLQIQARLTDLLVVYHQLAEHRLKDDFQRIFIENFDLIYDQGQEAVQKMVLANCMSTKQGNIINLIDNFLPENLLINEEKAIFCSLSSRNRGPRVLDLASFLRGYLGEHCWDFDLLNSLVQCYNEISPLNTEEKQFFLSIMRFPARFWLYSRDYLLREKGVPELTAKLANLIYETHLRDRCLDSLDSLLSEVE